MLTKFWRFITRLFFGSQHSMVYVELTQQMDPRLQKIIAFYRPVKTKVEKTTPGVTVNTIPIVAKVTNTETWKNLGFVKTISTINHDTSDDASSIITARIAPAHLEDLRNNPCVESLKCGHLLRTNLKVSTENTKARADLLPQNHIADGGDGVIVGIIDKGCDFAHRNFLKPSGESRLLSIWHQDGEATAASPLGYGREYLTDNINAALQSADPYGALGYGPRPDDQFQTGAHGTHVMDIAAGNGLGSGVPGYAPNADIIFVDISSAGIPFTGPQVVGSQFGDSIRLLEAVQYIFQKAGNRPCVINISLGTNGGPHDGSTLVEQGLDRLVKAAPNRAIVIAAANSYNDGIHASGQLTQGETKDLIWQIPAGDLTHNELEIWYESEDRIAVELITPNGRSLGIIEPGKNGSVLNGDNTLLFAANRLNDPNNNDNMIGIYFDNKIPPGDWTVRLLSRSITNGKYHAWIERDNFFPSRFAPPHDKSHTIGSISCGFETIVVGSYNAYEPSNPISLFSSSGPTRDGRQKPEVSAPGDKVVAAHSRTGVNTIAKSGTSMAAPAVTGLIALIFAEAQKRKIALTNQQVLQILKNSARPAENTSTAASSPWHPRFGFGRIDASAAISEVIRLDDGSDIPMV